MQRELPNETSTRTRTDSKIIPAIFHKTLRSTSLELAQKSSAGSSFSLKIIVLAPCAPHVSFTQPVTSQSLNFSIRSFAAPVVPSINGHLHVIASKLRNIKLAISKSYSTPHTRLYSQYIFGINHKCIVCNRLAASHDAWSFIHKYEVYPSDSSYSM